MRYCERGDRPPAKHLLNHRVDIWKVCAVVKRGQAAWPNDSIELGLRLLRDLRV